MEAGVGADGSRKRSSINFRGTEKEADFELAVMLVNAGKRVPPSSLRVKDFFTRIYLKDIERLVEKGILALSTYKGYESDVHLYIAAPPFGDIFLSNLTVRAIKNHFLEIASPGAAHSAWKTFRQGINYAVDDCELMEVNPLPRRIRLPEKEPYKPQLFTQDEIKRLLAALRGHWMEPMVLVGFGTGLRRGELCALLRQDINLQTGVVTVNKSLQYVDKKIIERKKTKTKKSERLVVLPTTVLNRLVEIAGAEAKIGPLVPSITDPHERMNPDLAAGYYTRFLERNGFKHVVLMNLRHTHATIAKNKGADSFDISNALGHENLKMGYEHYIGEQLERSRRVAQAIDEALTA